MVDIVKPVIILGGMKCGTTSLRMMLNQSKDIYFGKTERHYFNDNRKVTRFPNYLEFLAIGNQSDVVYVGDDTPAYSYLPEMAGNIFASCPDAKLIWMLRDPLERAVSNYWHAVRRGAETREINQAFKDEINGHTDSIWLRYIARSRYTEQVARYEQFFSKKDMLFLRLDDFAISFTEKKYEIEEFLGVDLSEVNEFPSANSAQFFGRPHLNLFLGLFSEKNKVIKGLSLIIRRVFSYKNRPLLEQNLSQEIQFILKDEYAFYEKISNI